MSVAEIKTLDKTGSPTGSQGQVPDLAARIADLEHHVRAAAQQGQPLHAIERAVFDRVLAIGHAAIDLFLQLQGDGDLGETVTTENGATLSRSESPMPRPLRTVFGQHCVSGYAYSRGVHEKIELRPLDARMALPPGIASYLFEEFSQFFCVEQAFGLSRKGLDMVLRQHVCEDQLQSINHRLAAQAEDYLNNLPVPPVDEEGELLVLTGDAKGVPLVRDDARRVPVTGNSPERPGNRRMATLAGVYTVDRYPRTPEQVLAALFRDRERPLKNDRPAPQFKEIIARFPRLYDNGDGETIEVSGTIEAFTWAAERVELRRKSRQELVRLLDGQESLREMSDVCLGNQTVDADVLDIVHAAGYVKRAANVFHTHEEHREAFSREMLLKILRGQTASVIHSLRIKATLYKLTGQKLKEIRTVCGYFQKNLDRMRYDEYLQKGYPIATGVIEGACRHLVKDRMERTGMRWRLPNAEAMLSVRAVFQSTHWSDFHQSRIEKEQPQVHPHRSLLDHYQPMSA